MLLVQYAKFDLSSDHHHDCVIAQLSQAHKESFFHKFLSVFAIFLWLYCNKIIVVQSIYLTNKDVC
jgi:hypothetical protein